MREIAIVTASKDPCNWVDSYEKKNLYFEFACLALWKKKIIINVSWISCEHMNNNAPSESILIHFALRVCTSILGIKTYHMNKITKFQL